MRTQGARHQGALSLLTQWPEMSTSRDWSAQRRHCFIARKRYEMSCGVENVADKVNWQYGAGAGGGAVPGPRRTVFGRISAKL